MSYATTRASLNSLYGALKQCASGEASTAISVTVADRMRRSTLGWLAQHSQTGQAVADTRVEPHGEGIRITGPAANGGIWRDVSYDRLIPGNPYRGGRLSLALMRWMERTYAAQLVALLGGKAPPAAQLVLEEAIAKKAPRPRAPRRRRTP